MNKKFPRIVVIGLDGATFDVIMPLAKRGVLPHLNRLIKNGVHGNLESTVQPMTPPGWISMYTGLNPGRHGIYDFWQHIENTYKLAPANYSSIAHRMFWKHLNSHGISTGLFNLPLTYPPHEVDGFMVTGMGTPGNVEPATYPANLIGGLKKAVPSYSVEGNHKLVQKNVFSFYYDALKVTRNRKKAFQWLINNNSCDFFMGVFTSTDRVQHFLWKYWDHTHPANTSINSMLYGKLLPTFWSRLDSHVGMIVNDLPEETDIVIVSDHGFGPLYKDVYINQWLSAMGYLRFNKKKIRSPGEFAETLLGSSKMMKWLHLDNDPDLTALIADCFDNLCSVTNERIVDRLFWSVVSPSLLQEEYIDWTRTKAFSHGYIGRIFINDKKRFPSGIVEPGYEYENLRDEIASKLKELKTPDGTRPLVDDIRFKENVYNGPYMDAAPDILFSMDGMKYITRQFARHQETSLFGEPDIGESATHRMNGIFIASGPSFKTRETISGAHITDIAPTLIHLAGAPVPDDLDGNVLLNIFDKCFLEKNELSYYHHEDQPATETYTYTEEERKSVEENLRNLGYI